MPGINYILQFAPNDTGINLLTDAAYLSAYDRTNGNQPGVASAKLVNKALRQSSLIAAGVAQFIVDSSGIDLADTLTAAQVADRIRSGVKGLLIGVRYFTTTSTYTKTPGTQRVRVTVIGGGGGGGGAATTGAGQCSSGSGGGGGGGARKLISENFDGVTITIGAGGGVTPGGNGGAGGTTSFGALVSATGGGAGLAGAAASNTLVALSGSAAGGQGSNGDLNMGGGYGNPGFYAVNPVSGTGGGVPFLGGGTIFTSGFSNGVAALSWGSGGSGGSASASSGSPAAGGSGRQGICIVEEYT